VQASADTVYDDFRDTFSTLGGRETLRAVLLFGVLLTILIAIVGHLMFQEVSLNALEDRVGLGTFEARRIADVVERVGLDRGHIDFSLIKQNKAGLEEFIAKRISDRPFISHVDVLDRFGVPQLSVSQGEAHEPRRPLLREVVPLDWPRNPITVRLRRAEGLVQVTLSQTPILEDLARMRENLKRQVAVAAAIAVIVLIVGLLYVLYLIRKNRGLEQSRLSAGRASYVGLLASGLAHEIRNPLNAMNMNLQMLEEELHADGLHEDGDHAELLESTKSEIKRLERLVNNFLAYARPAQPNFQRVDLNAIVDDVLRFLEVDFRQSDVVVHTNLAQLLPTAEIDETQFKQALMNLLVNARQILKNGGHVTVNTRAGTAGDVVLEVCDNGPGIPTEAQGRIFEVFYSRRGGGTGLGLPIARQIIERHGGSIAVDSVLGRGTTFRIRLPRRHHGSAERARPITEGVS
jgi:signal transduction histidine kinase